jgi:AraC family transcriptional regulator of adaptative response/methylated-DNA-[protein]-cysteine methyltransferase
MEDREYWKAVLDRDKHHDGKFVFAVRSTGVYCRPSCPSRRPRREHVQFFASPAQAEGAGFRACRRCQPDKDRLDEPHLELVEQICRYLVQPRERAVTLGELAQQFNLSSYHLQRTFKRIVGVTPREYAAAHRLERFKEHLKNGETVTNALYEAGYQSTGSIYGQAAERFGMTPTSYRRGGQMMHISYTITPCPLGWLLIAATEKGVCAVRLGDTEADLETTIFREFPTATIERDEANLGRWVAVLLGYLNGEQPHLDLPLDVQVTAFQRRVYEVLRTIPYGSTRSYQEVAKAIGQPGAARAVAHACAINPVALVIPCHRVVRGDGSPGGYRWGIARKKRLLDQESRHADNLRQMRLPYNARLGQSHTNKNASSVEDREA